MPNKKTLVDGAGLGSDRFESDTQKIVRKHLEDKDHVISDEELRNLRVGMTPPDAQQKSDEIVEEMEHEAEPTKNIKGTPAANPVTTNGTIGH